MNIMPIAVAVLRNAEGQVLLVRKRGTPFFMQPGGKIEGGEDARTALVRELEEELRIVVLPDALRFVGRAKAPAANEADVVVAAEIFDVLVDRPVSVQAEIEEAVWVCAAAPPDILLAPLTRDHILPLAVSLP